MRIAAFCRSTPAHFIAGGMERHLDQVVRGLAARGHDVTVFTTSLSSGASPDAEAPGLEFRYVPNLLPGRYLGGWWGRSRRAFLAEHRVKPFDVIFSQSAGAWGVLRVSRPKRPPCLAAMHGTTGGDVATAIRSRPYHPRTWGKVAIGLYHAYGYHRPLLPRCESVIAISDSVASRLEREVPGLRTPVPVIRNGIALGEGATADPAGSREVLYAGRVIPDKGVFQLLRAFASVAPRFPEFRLRYVGGGNCLDALAEEARGLGIADRVDFVGPVPHASMPAELARAALFVLPTLADEGLPLSLLEAMAAGLPVLSVARGGVGEALTDGEEGRLLPTVTEEALAEALVPFLSDPALRVRSGAAARSRVETDFDERVMLDAYQSALERLVSAGR
ncbi:MAG: glycosyltransferase family 4 protein [Candidatus Eisenbacteria bacterium]